MKPFLLLLTALVLIRDGEHHFMPPEDTPLALGDQVLLVGKPGGLAIARDIARSHGGDINLGDSPRGGLRATVRVPV